jgi:hypothetical protein
VSAAAVAESVPEAQELTWWPDRGMGFYPVDPADEPYDAEYFERYRGYEQTEMGQRITAERVALVDTYTRGLVLDVGIGSGHFVDVRTRCRRVTFGYDVNPAGVEWLKRRGLFLDPCESLSVPAVTLWDVLEHLPEPAELLKRVSGYVFACLPIFRDREHALSSKHFRPDEHRWYWTRPGLIRWMEGLGFELRAELWTEIELGREDIETFAFRRAS